MGHCFSVQIGLDNLVIRSCDSIAGQANYICKLKQTLLALSAALDELKAQRNDVQRKVALAEQRLMTRLDRVQLWLSEAQKMITKAESLVADDPQEKDNLCLGSCVFKNCVASYKFGKKVEKMLEDIKDHTSKGAFEEVAERQPAAPFVVRPAEQPIALESTIDKVWSCIMDKDVRIIGLYGIEGVGKTTLMTQINNKFTTTPKSFDLVIWSSVSKDYIVANIQDEIGEQIGFSNDSGEWKNKSIDLKAKDIHRVLLNKKVVVLLDDLWERLDLNKVGIPTPSKQNGSKLIFTTRYIKVCDQMEARKKIQVECLKPEDAWKLFKDKVGEETLNSHQNIRGLAKQAAKECGGLPLTLITIGRAMASKTTPRQWKHAIFKLKLKRYLKMSKPRHLLEAFHMSRPLKTTPYSTSDNSHAVADPHAGVGGHVPALNF